MNLLVISGRLGQNAEVRATASGKTVASFSVAVDSGYGDNKKTSWFRCSLWGKRAEGGLIQYLTKGTQVIVTGDVSLNEYESKGVNKASLEVFVDKLDLVGGNQERPAQTGERASTTQAQQQPTPDGFDDLPF